MVGVALHQDWIPVTDVAEQVGQGFDLVGLPVFISREVWDQCVVWDDTDSERQTYQEEDARLWDLLWTAGTTLGSRYAEFTLTGTHVFTILCMPKDGVSTVAHDVKLVLEGTIVRGQNALVLGNRE